ncbi:MAG: RNA 2',3'-cyclic phosphodiesterase [Candidatus Anoxychlamydiales bacterium]|nr:RNA 2',3'-cyclic phosphodiesterase [Candidatus Anoxychlamydiales bacterium]
MVMEKNTRKLFFAFEIETIWIDNFKNASVVDKKNRHLTLLFLGENDLNEIKKQLDLMPKLNLLLGSCGYFDKPFFLPKNNSRVAAYNAIFLEDNAKIENYQKNLYSFFLKEEFNLKNEKDFLPHITILRKDFEKKEFEKQFKQTPFYLKSFNLYESLFHSNYKALWKMDYLAPFIELKHTADIAFEVRGKDFDSLLLHSFIALCFKEFKLLKYKKNLKKVSSIDDIIIDLNEILTLMEIDGYQASFKAISFNQKNWVKDNIIYWEMVIDV